MTTAVTVILAVAKELANQAIDSLPKIREGEKINREWYEDGKYYRETVFEGDKITTLYDFRQRKTRSIVS